MFYKEFDLLTPDEVSKNINRQATKILLSLKEAYLSGLLDDPKSSFTYSSLLACICEGKVEGVVDEHQNKVSWSLTKDYEAQLKEYREAALQSGKIVQGPWA